VLSQQRCNYHAASLQVDTPMTNGSRLSLMLVDTETVSVTSLRPLLSAASFIHKDDGDNSCLLVNLHSCVAECFFPCCCSCGWESFAFACLLFGLAVLLRFP